MKTFNEYLEKNKEILKQALEIDNSKFKENYKYENIFKQDKFDIELEKNKTYLVIYEGEPEITKFLCEKAIEFDANLILTINDYYLAINTIISGIAMKKIKEEKLNLFIKVYNKIEEEKIVQSSYHVDETIYIGLKEDFKHIEKILNSKLRKIEY